MNNPNSINWKLSLRAESSPTHHPSPFSNFELHDLSCCLLMLKWFVSFVCRVVLLFFNYELWCHVYDLCILIRSMVWSYEPPPPSLSVVYRIFKFCFVFQHKFITKFFFFFWRIITKLECIFTMHVVNCVFVWMLLLSCITETVTTLQVYGYFTCVHRLYSSITLGVGNGCFFPLAMEI